MGHDSDFEKRDHADTQLESVLHDCWQTGTPDLRILHFNDVYHPHGTEEEPTGGAARIKTVFNHYRCDEQYKDSPKPLTLFSGDCFNPSSESSVTKGSHMVQVMNELGIDAACVGNHEFDFGAAHFAYLAKDCNFPWLLSNLFDPDLGEMRPLGNCRESLMLETSNGIKVGLMGLVEREWTEKINTSLPSDIEYFDMKETAKRLAPQLREQGADLVIAITHARSERDYDFCENMPAGAVDIVLAGHDHWVEHKKFPNDMVMIRSGYDFKNLTHTDGYRQKDGRWRFTTVRKNLPTAVEEDQRLRALCQDITADIHRKMELPLGFTAVPLEARKTQCQTQESNFGNFLADLMQSYYHSDCALINGGTFSADRIYHPGQLLLKDIVNCFTFEDPVVVIKLPGHAIHAALENGVSHYPSPDACFPQVSNIAFHFDPSARAGERVKSVHIKGHPLDPAKEYTLATRSHLASGKCGYATLKTRRDGGDAVEVIDEENGVLVTGLLRQYFTWLAVSEAFRWLVGGDEAKDSHRAHVVKDMGRRKAVYSSQEEKHRRLQQKVVWKWQRLALDRCDVERQMAEGNGEFFDGWSKGIAPRVEGRSSAITRVA